MKYQIVIDRKSDEDLRIGHPREVFDVVKEFIDEKKNTLFVLLLDGASYLQKIHIMDVKELDPELPHIIFNLALLSKSSSIVTIHNRKSKISKPSIENIKIVEDLVMKWKFLKIEVLDHLLVSGTGYFSYAENNLSTLSKDDVWPYKMV
ncbi:hypothetical protein EW093_00995 [Thiospirochaeta perfilievii]|uniref:RadC-like JAB domain-containing protein n=1 Tax=Thiospirochaeta perfilievii TaxID=252967 RepID=A0A5C1Q8W4_9SPIO|nr:JAB domain-containing protein [Thiospirochaeta perfilievii]QEN03339.1 hypothetical protein EW093_00995 [Thiospirochaeta perfilievii]